MLTKLDIVADPIGDIVSSPEALIITGVLIGAVVAVTVMLILRHFKKK